MARSARPATEAARTASATMNKVATQVGHAIQEVANQACATTTKQADNVTANFGSSLRQLGDRFETNSPDGYWRCASETVADNFKRGGAYLERAQFRGAALDLGMLIKRNPISTGLIAAGLVWFLSRRR